jgi:hypothetical protein
MAKRIPGFLTFYDLPSAGRPRLSLWLARRTATAIAIGVALSAMTLVLIGRASAADAPAVAAKAATEPKWESLFDGKTLKGWKAPQFGGEGKVTVKDGAIVLEHGESMTGITYTGKTPTVDYELALEAKRVDGVDFFATTTFPVDKSHCSFVVGGWGGPVVGLSSVDHYDAADNQTTRTRSFKTGQWYRVRIRVTKEKIQAWIDDEKMVDLVYRDPKDPQDTAKNHKISIRMECDLCRPLGISTWCTTGAVRNVRIRPLSAEELKKAAEEASADPQE